MIKAIDVTKIKGGSNVRNERDETILELAQSIEKNGLINPITVRPLGNDEFEIIAGHRRFEAVKQLGEPFIDCSIVEGVSDKERLILQIVENVQRKNMSAYEYVEVFEDLREKYNYDQTQIGKLFNKSHDWVSQQYCAVRLLEKQYRTGETGEINIPEEEKKKSASLIKAEHKRRVIKDVSENFDCKGMSVRKHGHTYQIYCYDFDAEMELQKLFEGRK